MYKFLLCWRYLRTRYIALVSIVSVMLGVATMIVVNAVMEGFTHEMQERIHGILSDVVFESRSLDGIPDADRHMDEIRRVAAAAKLQGVTAGTISRRESIANSSATLPIDRCQCLARRRAACRGAARE